jgi:hypothetical protein
MKSKNKRGEIMVDVLVKFLVVTVFLLTLVEFYALFMRYQNVSYVARRLTRSIEVSGTTEGANGDFANLISMANLDGASFTIDAPYFDSSGKIQLRDTFAVEVRFTYYINVFSPTVGPPMRLPISMTARMGGMSEVFHKTP